VAKKIIFKLVTTAPLYGMGLGLVCGLSGLNLPNVIKDFFSTISRANGVSCFPPFGTLSRPEAISPQEMWKLCIGSLGLRYGLGISTALALFLGVGGKLSPLCRMVLLLGFIMPVPMISSIYASEAQLDPSLPSLLINLSIHHQLRTSVGTALNIWSAHQSN